MERINLTIPMMKSSHCQLTVTEALKAIGARVSAIAPTKAEIEFENTLTADIIKAAIENAGYKISQA